MIQSLRFKIIVLCYGFLKRFQLRKGILFKLSERLRLSILRRTDKPSWKIEIARNQGVKVGENCRFYSANFFSEPYLVEIGDNVIISGDVKFLTHDGSYYLFKSREDGCIYGKIIIGNNCFIGMSAIITPNTIIGDNCIIGSGAVVRGKISDNSVVIGNPGKIIYKTQIIKKLLLSSKYQIKHPWGNEELREKIILNHFSKF